MSKYDLYCCSSLLNYFDSLYENDTDHTNYSEYLLSMQNSSKIEHLIKIYDRVLWKFIVSFNGFGDEELVTKTWYDINTLPSNTKPYLDQLNCFLNENIARLFQSQEYSDTFAIKCFLNIREASNASIMREMIFSKCSKNVISKKGEIMSSLTIVNEAPNYVSPYNLDTNGCIEHKKIYIEKIKYLINNGYIRSKKDSDFEKKTQISYFANSSDVGYLIVKVILLSVVTIACVFLLYKAFLFFIIILALCSYVWKGK